MANFFFKLLPPRADFVQTMSDEERAQMGLHAAYIDRFFQSGKVLCYGPVFSQDDGSYGFGVLDMQDMAEVEAFAQGDPTIQSGMNDYSVAPMVLGGAQAPHATA